MNRRPGAAVPWRAVLLWALLGTVASASVALWDLAGTDEQLGPLVTTSPGGPAAPLLLEDLGPDALNEGGSHDGAYYYAVARRPWDLVAAAESLDAPRYRMQRIVYPVLARVGYPVGQGTGLMWSMFVVGVLGVFLGGAGVGALCTTLRGPPWPAVVFGLLPGVFLSLRISVADPLALALVVWALFFAIRNRWGAAVAFACVAVLTKELMVLVLIGYAIHRRDRRGVVLVLAPAAMAAVWAAVLFVSVPAGTNSARAFAMPGKGAVDAVRFWIEGNEPLGLLAVVVGLGLALAAVAKRGVGHPLAWATLVQLAFLVIVHVDTLAPERNGSRLVMPLAVLGLVMLATPTPGARRAEELPAPKPVTA